MEKFFDTFRDNLERRPEPFFEEKDWVRLQQRLEAKEAKKPRAFVWMWLPVPLLLVLLGANGWLFMKNREQGTGNNFQGAGNREQGTGGGEPRLRRDTVFVTQVVYVKDTVYRNVAFSPAEYSLHVVDNQEDRGAEKHPDTIVSYASADPEEAALVLVEEVTMKGDSTEEKEVFRPRLPVASAPKTIAGRLESLKPRSIRAGITGGVVLPLGGELGYQPGYAVGVQGSLLFPGRIQIWAGASISYVHLVAQRMGEDIGIPVVPSPSEDFVFVQAEAHQPSVQGSLGLQYHFRTKSALHPFAGLGYGIEAGLPHEAVYDFRNASLGVEWSYDQWVTSRWKSGFLMPVAGVEYDILPHLNFSLQAQYRIYLREREPLPSGVSGLQAALLYRIK